MMLRGIPYFLSVFLFICAAGSLNSKAQAANNNEKEAAVWYLGHSGWAIKTTNHLLIFDYYSEGGVSIKNPAPAFGLEGQQVFVFISHAHQDHFDADVFRWRKFVKNILYILGFEVLPGPNLVCLGPKEKKKIDNIEIFTIKATDAGVGYLVDVDRLVVFHAGDHENGEGLWQAYVREIDYLAKIGKKIDLAFFPVAREKGKWWHDSNKGTFYAIEKLSPQVVFPMHAGGQEYWYLEFVKEAEKHNFNVTYCYPARGGDKFFYRGGKIEKKPGSN